jgi:DNA-binding IclR family transcriptional regulator
MSDLDGARKADIQAVSRASRILALFNVDRTELATADVSKALGLNRTTTHRYLTSMTAVGLLGYGSRHSSYVVGPLSTRLGAIAAGSTPALSVAPRHMQALSDTVGAAVTLTLRASSGPMVTHVAEPRTSDAVLTVKVGTVLPADSAQGVIFAAFARDEAGAPGGTRHPGLSRSEQVGFEQELVRVREQGTCIRRDAQRGFIAVAAPIFDTDGVCAASAIVSLTNAAAEAAMPERARQIQRMAAQVSAELARAAAVASEPGY